jgi:dethiobiotin synthetase
MNLKFACFVTGTDTGVGKTLISAALLHGLSRAGLATAGMKPLAAGAEIRDGVLQNDDVSELEAASSLSLPRDLIVPYLLREPAAPHIAAVLENTLIDPQRLLTAYAQIAAKAEAVVVEGVGGFRVPLTDDFDTADLAKKLQLDVILVVGLRLGCLNHALLTAEAIAARGLRLAGWVANQIDPAMPHQRENIDTLSQRLPAPLLGVVPHMTQASAASAARYIDFRWTGVVPAEFSVGL